MPAGLARGEDTTGDNNQVLGGSKKRVSSLAFGVQTTLDLEHDDICDARDSTLRDDCGMQSWDYKRSQVAVAGPTLAAHQAIGRRSLQKLRATPIPIRRSRPSRDRA